MSFERCHKNIIFISILGECIVKSSNGMQAKFTFQKAGWMGGSKNEVIGEIKDEKNNKLKSMFGRWDEGIYLGENSQTVSYYFKEIVCLAIFLG